MKSNQICNVPVSFQSNLTAQTSVKAHIEYVQTFISTALQKAVLLAACEMGYGFTLSMK